MSKNVKVKSTLPHRANQTITLPEGLGQIVFDKDCEVEVSEEIASKIIPMEIGISYAGEEEKDNSDSGSTGDGNTFSKESLMKLTVKALKETCIETDIPEEEYKKITKKEPLVNLILEKLKAEKE